MTTPPPPSFVAVLSDIHSNIDALDAVLTDAAQWDCRAFVCLGDTIGYGPEPAACVERIREISAATVLGNHELMFVVREQLTHLPKSLEVPMCRAAEQLSAAQVEWLAELPFTAQYQGVTLSHGSLHDVAEFDYIFELEDAEAHFAAQSTQVSFHGHSHYPAVWERQVDEISSYVPSGSAVMLDAGDRYAINPGSVGQPRDGDPRAGYALYDPGARLLLHRRVEYDVERAMARFRAAGIPGQNARRLRRGN